jgi:hypothetical protein
MLLEERFPHTWRYRGNRTFAAEKEHATTLIGSLLTRFESLTIRGSGRVDWTSGAIYPTA